MESGSAVEKFYRDGEGYKERAKREVGVVYLLYILWWGLHKSVHVSKAIEMYPQKYQFNYMIIKNKILKLHTINESSQWASESDREVYIGCSNYQFLNQPVMEPKNTSKGKIKQADFSTEHSISDETEHYHHKILKKENMAQ